MNYIELINNVWSLREQGLITSLECDLYLYLVHRCNRLQWKNPFTQSTDITCAVLGINRNALISRRNRLKQLGLIDFKEGFQRARPPIYTLCSLKDTQTDTQSDTQTNTQTDTQTGLQTATSYKNNTIQNKTIVEREGKVDYKFIFSVFNDTCKSLAKVDKLTDERRRKLDAIVHKMGLEKLLKCFEMVEESYFLSKRKGKWRATFDWIIEPDNMEKILEGCYSHESNDTTTSAQKPCSASGAKQYGADKWAEAIAEITGGAA